MTVSTESTIWTAEPTSSGSTQDEREALEQPISAVRERVTEILGYDIFARESLADGYREYADESLALAEGSTAAALEVLPEA